MELIEYLMQFGLTRQEATIYILLFQEGELNGYEVSKLTGISRSNAYGALAGLVENGAAYMIEEAATKYTPVPVDEFCENKIRRMNRMSKELANSMPARRQQAEGYITIRGEQQILDKLVNMVERVQERIYLSMSHERLEMLRPYLLGIRRQNKKIVLITDPPFEMEGAILYHAWKPMDQIRVIVDSRYVLTGAVNDSENATCLYSSNNNLVEIFKEALRNEIQLIELREQKTNREEDYNHE